MCLENTRATEVSSSFNSSQSLKAVCLYCSPALFNDLNGAAGECVLGVIIVKFLFAFFFVLQLKNYSSTLPSFSSGSDASAGLV